MKSAFMLGAAALVASCAFAQDVFAQRGGFREAGFRAAAPEYIGRPKLRVVVRPRLRWGDPPELIHYPYSDSPGMCQLELPHSILRVLQERATVAGLGMDTSG